MAERVTNFLVKFCSYLPKSKILREISVFSKNVAFLLRLNFEYYFFGCRKKCVFNKVFLKIKKTEKEI